MDFDDAFGDDPPPFEEFDAPEPESPPPPEAAEAQEPELPPPLLGGGLSLVAPRIIAKLIDLSHHDMRHSLSVSVAGGEAGEELVDTLTEWIATLQTKEVRSSVSGPTVAPSATAAFPVPSAAAAAADGEEPVEPVEPQEEMKAEEKKTAAAKAEEKGKKKENETEKETETETETEDKDTQVRMEDEEEIVRTDTAEGAEMRSLLREFQSATRIREEMRRLQEENALLRVREQRFEADPLLRRWDLTTSSREFVHVLVVALQNELGEARAIMSKCNLADNPLFQPLLPPTTGEGKQNLDQLVKGGFVLDATKGPGRTQAGAAEAAGEQLRSSMLRQQAERGDAQLQALRLRAATPVRFRDSRVERPPRDTSSAGIAVGALMDALSTAVPGARDPSDGVDGQLFLRLQEQETLLRRRDGAILSQLEIERKLAQAKHQLQLQNLQLSRFILGSLSSTHPAMHDELQRGHCAWDSEHCWICGRGEGEAPAAAAAAGSDGSVVDGGISEEAARQLDQFPQAMKVVFFLVGGGRTRASVPDLQRYLRQYRIVGESKQALLRQCMDLAAPQGGQGPARLADSLSLGEFASVMTGLAEGLGFESVDALLTKILRINDEQRLKATAAARTQSASRVTEPDGSMSRSGSQSTQAPRAPPGQTPTPTPPPEPLVSSSSSKRPPRPLSAGSRPPQSSRQAPAEVAGPKTTRSRPQSARPPSASSGRSSPSAGSSRPPSARRSRSPSPAPAPAPAPSRRARSPPLKAAVPRAATATAATRRKPDSDPSRAAFTQKARVIKKAPSPKNVRRARPTPPTHPKKLPASAAAGGARLDTALVLPERLLTGQAFGKGYHGQSVRAAVVHAIDAAVHDMAEETQGQQQGSGSELAVSEAKRTVLFEYRRFLHMVFDFYAKGRMSQGRSRTFDEIRRTQESLDQGAFVRFLRDYEVTPTLVSKSALFNLLLLPPRELSFTNFLVRLAQCADLAKDRLAYVYSGVREQQEAALLECFDAEAEASPTGEVRRGAWGQRVRKQASSSKSTFPSDLLDHLLRSLAAEKQPRLLERPRSTPLVDLPLEWEEVCNALTLARLAHDSRRQKMVEAGQDVPPSPNKKKAASEEAGELSLSRLLEYVASKSSGNAIGLNDLGDGMGPARRPSAAAPLAGTT